MKHSPGPWRTCAASHGKCSCGLVWDATGEWAPAIVQQNSEELGACVDPEQAWADGRLIAAAPEMLALLCEFRDRAFEDTGLDWDARASLLIDRVLNAPTPKGPVTP